MKPLTPTTPHIIMMVGIPGAGKTTFAERFAKTFSAPYLNPRGLSHKAGISIDKAESATQVFLEELLKTNRTLLYEGPVETKAERIEVIKQAKKAGYQTLLVWVQTEQLEARRRAMRRQQEGRPLSADEFENALAYFQAPEANEKPVVISGRHTYATQLKTVLKNLAVNHRPSTPIPLATGPSTPRSGRNIVIR